jgi:hypothetical protein
VVILLRCKELAGTALFLNAAYRTALVNMATWLSSSLHVEHSSTPSRHMHIVHSLDARHHFRPTLQPSPLVHWRVRFRCTAGGQPEVLRPSVVLLKALLLKDSGVIAEH